MSEYRHLIIARNPDEARAYRKAHHHIPGMYEAIYIWNQDSLIYLGKIKAFCVHLTVDPMRLQADFILEAFYKLAPRHLTWAIPSQEEDFLYNFEIIRERMEFYAR